MALAYRTTLKAHASITPTIQKNTNGRQCAANASARQTGTVNKQRRSTAIMAALGAFM
jgi:hypothetical protein